MYTRSIAALVLVGLMGPAGAAVAATLETADITFEREARSETEGAYVAIEMPAAVTRLADTEVTGVFIEFRAPLSPGQEVELWMDTGTRAKPWDTPETYHLRKAHWVADERTGEFVRLDVTWLVREYLSSKERFPGILIRVAPGTEDEIYDLVPPEGTKARLVLRTR